MYNMYKVQIYSYYIYLVLLSSLKLAVMIFFIRAVEKCFFYNLKPIFFFKLSTYLIFRFEVVLILSLLNVYVRPAVGQFWKFRIIFWAFQIQFRFQYSIRFLRIIIFLKLNPKKVFNLCFTNFESLEHQVLHMYVS